MVGRRKRSTRTLSPCKMLMIAMGFSLACPTALPVSHTGRRKISAPSEGLPRIGNGVTTVKKYDRTDERLGHIDASGNGEQMLDLDLDYDIRGT